jgi:hypothetical protein
MLWINMMHPMMHDLAHTLSHSLTQDEKSKSYRERMEVLKSYSAINDLPKTLIEAMREHVELQFHHEQVRGRRGGERQGRGRRKLYRRHAADPAVDELTWSHAARGMHLMHAMIVSVCMVLAHNPHTIAQACHAAAFVFECIAQLLPLHCRCRPVMRTCWASTRPPSAAR